MVSNTRGERPTTQTVRIQWSLKSTTFQKWKKSPRENLTSWHHLDLSPNMTLQSTPLLSKSIFQEEGCRMVGIIVIFNQCCIQDFGMTYPPPLPPVFNIFLIKSPFSAKIGLKSRPTPLFRPRTAYCIQHWLELKLSGFAYLMSTPKPQSFSSQLSWRTRISFFRFLPQASWGGKKHPYYKKEFFTNSNSWKIFYNMICFFTDVLSSSKSTWLSAHDLSSAILNTSNVRLAVYVWKLSS